MGCRAALVAVVALLAFPAHADIVGKARVVDGDTLEIAGQRIRLHGIDAPESQQTCWAGGTEWACGREATFALAYEMGRHWVTCRAKGGDGAIGRKLDFLCQEFNREANTLCSKSVDLALTRVGIELKAGVEQLREQVQNIE